MKDSLKLLSVIEKEIMCKKIKGVGKVVPLKKSKCPICSNLSLDQTKPFCSSRCANLDLGRWLDGKYRIFTDETPDSGTFVEKEDD